MKNPFSQDNIKVDHLPEVIWAKALNAQGMLAPLSDQKSLPRFHVSSDAEGGTERSPIVAALSEYGLCVAQKWWAQERQYDAEKIEKARTSIFHGSLVASAFLLPTLSGVGWVSNTLLLQGVRQIKGEPTQADQNIISGAAEDKCKAKVVSILSKDYSQTLDNILVKGDFEKAVANAVSGEQLGKTYQACLQQQTADLSSPEMGGYEALVGGLGVSMALAVVAWKVFDSVSCYKKAQIAKADCVIAKGNAELADAEGMRRYGGDAPVFPSRAFAK